jgi:predicted nucleic acid-binding protein
VILLDAYAIVAFLVGGPAAPHVRVLLREGNTGVATANLAEALDVSQRIHGLPVGRALEVLEPLFGSSLAALALDLLVARRAAEVRAAHYDRAARPISLADAILVATARSGDRLATADPDLLAVARAEALETIALPGQG